MILGYKGSSADVVAAIRGDGVVADNPRCAVSPSATAKDVADQAIFYKKRKSVLNAA